MTTARTENTLTPEGAQLLRAARDQIVAHPEAFDMGFFHCGTVACIGGTVCTLARVPHYSIDASYALGFGYEMVTSGTPLYDLFFDWPRGASRDVHVAAERINAFLWHYGYPPSEVADASATAADAVAGDGELTQADPSRC